MAMLHAELQERRAQMHQAAAMMYAALGDGEEAVKHIRKYQSTLFPELGEKYKNWDSRAEKLLKKIADKLHFSARGGVGMDATDLLRQYKTQGLNFNEAESQTGVRVGRDGKVVKE